MEFEDILKDVGDNGLFQKLLNTFVVPTCIAIPLFSLNSIFISSAPDHWCYVPEVDSLELTLEEKKNLIRPNKDPFCSRYDVNFTNILKLGKNFTLNDDCPVRNCDMGWQYDTSNYDETAVTKWDLVCENEYYQSMIVSLVFVGVLLGTPIYSFLSDRCGRKPMLFSLFFLVFVSELCSAFSPNFTIFLFLRVLIGSTMNSMYGLGYIVVLELVRPDLRARTNGITTNCWTVGLCILPLLAYLTRSWFYLTIVMSATAACLLLSYKMFPESPSWLISQERYEEAADIMARISKMNGSSITYEQLLQNIQILGRKKKDACTHINSPLDFFRSSAMRKRFFLVVSLWIGVSVPYYGLQVNSTNLNGNEFLNFFLISIVEIPAHLFTWWLLGNIGRKKSLLFGFMVCGVSCLMPTFFPAEFMKLGVVITVIAKAGAGAAFMALYQLCPELFPTSLRGVAMGWSGTLGMGSTLIVPYIAQLDKYGSHYPFLVFFVICLISGIFGSFLPETSKDNLPQTVEDVEKNDRNENFIVCGCKGQTSYDFERRKSSDIWSTMTPPSSFSKDIKEPKALNITPKFYQ